MFKLMRKKIMPLLRSNVWNFNSTADAKYECNVSPDHLIFVSFDGLFMLR